MKKNETLIDRLYEHWENVKQDTILSLAEEVSFHIADFHGNNRIDITSWILSEYRTDEQHNIVNFQFQTLFKETYWLQFLFHTANYSMIYRNLRYDLEMMTQAYYIDKKYPRLGLDAQFGKLVEEEKYMFGWKFMKNELADIFKVDSETIHVFFHPIWDYLNKHVHSSGIQMDIIAEKNIESLVKDSYNQELAEEALEIIDSIFEAIYMVTFRKCPDIISKAMNYKHINEWEKYLPKLVTHIKNI